ncbi:hypothetical protein UK23_06000 [Lentzea aerocolonigenes]|uniref:Uncharacterized protein n=1 Tax=Lentzea aerocolonigenes TaxID=68170 RepID=A0A0F0H840_LENAE|nr:hypothetical protein UK23_06000 [Lentzea aerocolonigenes]
MLLVDLQGLDARGEADVLVSLSSTTWRNVTSVLSPGSTLMWAASRRQAKESITGGQLTNGNST